MPKMIKGFFILPQVENTNSPKYPALKINVRSFNRETGKQGDLIAGSVTAMIDTGSNYSHLEEEIITKAGLRVDGAISNISQYTGHEARADNLYAVFIEFMGANTGIALPVSSQPFRRNKRNFDFIIGMNIIENGVLTVNYKADKVELELH